MSESISIITPFYNGNKYIEALSNYIFENAVAIHKLFPNTVVEWILVNDSPNVSVDKAKIHNGVKYKIINHKKNSGIHQARVTGLNATDTKYVVFLDQDDEIYHDFLLDQYLKIKNADVIVCNGYVEDDFGRKENIYKSVYELKESTYLNTYLYIANVIRSPGQCMIKRISIPVEWKDNIIQHNGSDDFLLWIMMLARKSKFIINEKCLYMHKYTGTNLSNSDALIHDSSLEMLDIIKRTGILSDKEKDILNRSIEWSFRRRNGGSFKFVLFNFDLVLYKGKSHIMRVLSKKIA